VYDSADMAYFGSREYTRNRVELGAQVEDAGDAKG